MRFVVSMTALVLSISWAVPASSEPLTPAEALREALARNPQVTAARAQVEAARGRVDQGVSRWLPSLSATAAYSRQTGNFAPRPGLSLSNLGAAGSAVQYRSTNDSYDYFSLGLSLQQTIWDFGRTLGVSRQASAGLEAASEDLETVRDRIWIDVVEAFHRVLAAEEMLGMTTRNEEQAQRHLELAVARVEAGMRPPIDRVRGQADLEGARAARVAAENGVLLAREALGAVLGRPEWIERSLAAPDIGAQEVVFDADQVLADALEKRPERAALRARIRAQEAVVLSQQGLYWPILSANAFFTDTGLDLREMVWNWGAGLSLTVPILSAPQTAGQVREARALLVALRAQLDSLEWQVRLEVRQALARVRDASRRLVFLEAQAALGREALDMAEGRYEAGTGTLLELLDARNALANAEAQRIQGRLDLAVARALLVRVSGRVPMDGMGEAE